MSKHANKPAKAVAAVAVGVAVAVAGTKLARRVVGQAGKALGAAPEQPNRATQTLTIGASTEELFRFYREPTNFQRILRNLAEIQPRGDGGAHWKVPGPDGNDLEWDARLAEERPGEQLRWTPAPGSGTSGDRFRGQSDAAQELGRHQADQEQRDHRGQDQEWGDNRGEDLDRHAWHRPLGNSR